MKILVFSDSHGADDKIARAIGDNSTADGYVFLGDGGRDFEYALSEYGIYPYGDKVKEVFQVRGNCDIYSTEPDSITAELDGLRVFMAHGNAQKVKRGLEYLASEAASKNCQIALYGHTHERHLSKNQGVMLFNPGSVHGGSYGIVTLGGKKPEFAWADI